jgi:hypothetical protein
MTTKDTTKSQYAQYNCSKSSWQATCHHCHWQDTFCPRRSRLHQQQPKHTASWARSVSTLPLGERIRNHKNDLLHGNEITTGYFHPLACKWRRDEWHIEWRKITNAPEGWSGNLNEETTREADMCVVGLCKSGHIYTQGEGMGYMYLAWDSVEGTVLWTQWRFRFRYRR